MNKLGHLTQKTVHQRSFRKGNETTHCGTNRMLPKLHSILGTNRQQKADRPRCCLSGASCFFWSFCFSWLYRERTVSPVYCRSEDRILGVTHGSYCSHSSIDTSVCCVFIKCCTWTDNALVVLLQNTWLYGISRELRLNFVGGTAYKHDV